MRLESRSAGREGPEAEDFVTEEAGLGWDPEGWAGPGADRTA